MVLKIKPKRRRRGNWGAVIRKGAGMTKVSTFRARQILIMRRQQRFRELRSAGSLTRQCDTLKPDPQGTDLRGRSRPWHEKMCSTRSAFDTNEIARLRTLVSQEVATVKYATSGVAVGSDVASPTAHTITRVGARIRARRKAEGFTLSDIAERTGISVSMLSMLERGLAGASIGTLVAVASALNMQMYDLFEEPEDSAPEPVTRRDDQPQVETSEGVVRRVAHHSHADGLEMALNEYEPHTASSADATHHPGREYGILLSGSLVIELDGVEHALCPGDAITYDSTVPHRIVNPGRSRAQAVWVNLIS